MFCHLRTRLSATLASILGDSSPAFSSPDNPAKSNLALSLKHEAQLNHCFASFFTSVHLEISNILTIEFEDETNDS